MYTHIVYLMGCVHNIQIYMSCTDCKCNRLSSKHTRALKHPIES